MGLSQTRTRLVRRLHRRRTREREALVLAEGVRVANEVLKGGRRVRFAVVSPRLAELDGGTLVARLKAEGIDVAAVDHQELATLADTESPQGILLVCDEPDYEVGTLLAGRPRLLILDGIQDPGNAGTLIRTAAAFGMDGVLALDGTVDPWNPKAVRASAGTAFRIPVASGTWNDVNEVLRSTPVPLWVADAAGEPVPERAPPAPWALVVGSEGGGVRQDIRDRAVRTVSVPMPGGTESLNAGVAGAILLYALTRGGDGA